jgi:hypothetical protein
MASYSNITLYIESATNLKDQIARYDAIIAALETTALNSAGNIDIEEYQLDDGQTRIRNSFRDPNQIFKAIDNYSRLRQRAINKLNGSVVRLVDYNSNC